MANILTPGLFFPSPVQNMGTAPGFANSLLIDATGEKIAFIGRFWNKDRATKNITKVGFCFGAVTKAGGSGLTVSLQNVNLGAGPPFRPDEIQDQTVAIANGDAAFATNTWYQTAALSTNRTVAFGELLAVVIEYNGAGRLGSDSVVVRGTSVDFQRRPLPLRPTIPVLSPTSWRCGFLRRSIASATEPGSPRVPAQPVL
jgi:hypothetical protein